MQRLKGYVLIGIASIGTALVVAGCAGVPAAPARALTTEDKQKLVAQRVNERWETLIKGDVESAYTFLSPGSRATTTLEAYKTKVKPGMWTKAKVESVSCQDDVCKATLTITYDAKRMKGIETQLAESWIIENGTAWYVYR